MIFWNFFKSGTKESMTRLISFALTVVVVIMSLSSIFLVANEKFDLGFAAFILSLASAALTGKVQGAKVENKTKNE